MPPPARRVNRILRTTGAENAVLLTLNNRSNRGRGLRLNNRIIAAMGYRRSPSIAAIQILTPLQVLSVLLRLRWKTIKQPLGAILTSLQKALVVLKSLAFLFRYVISSIYRKPVNAIVNTASIFTLALQGLKVIILFRMSFIISSLVFLVDRNSNIAPARALLIVQSLKAAIK